MIWGQIFGETVVTKVQGVQFDFSPIIINVIYGLPDVDNRVYKECFWELES